jgi:molybdopterin molybdotransferase
MAQLSDDCFAFGGPMMSVDEAVSIIAARVTAVGDVEVVSLTEADGRILAKDIAAPLPLPPFTNSAVDGYAVRSGDLPQLEERTFPVAGRVQAGASVHEPIKPGHATRIFTGAPLPQGADTVFMQEDVRLDQGRVVLPAGLKPGANVRPAGEDIAIGHPALKSGQRLRPQDVALAAAFGLTHVEVRRRIRVAVFSTGNELVSPGARATIRFQSFHADGNAGTAWLRGQQSRHPQRRSRVTRERPEEGGGCA